MLSPHQNEQLKRAVSILGTMPVADKLRAIGEDPATYPPQALERLDWFANISHERAIYILQISRIEGWE